MARDQVEQWLTEVDDSGWLPGMPADLPARVRGRLARRRRNRRAGGVAVVLLACGILLSFHTRRGSESSTEGGTPDVAAADLMTSIRAELKGLEVLQGEAMNALEGLARAAEATAPGLEPSPPSERVNEQLEQAARLLVYQGDRLRNELNLLQEAAKTYRSAIELFPETQTAQIARERLGELRS